MRQYIIQIIGISVVTAIISLLAINSFVFTRTEASLLQARVLTNEQIVRDQYNVIDKKIDDIKSLLIQECIK